MLMRNASTAISAAKLPRTALIEMMMVATLLSPSNLKAKRRKNYVAKPWKVALSRRSATTAPDQRSRCIRLLNNSSDWFTEACLNVSRL